jgi:hypothetical protein
MRFFYSFLKACALTLFFVSAAMAQETTGGLQGIVKDPSGAVVPNAHVVVTGSALVGSKEADTDTVGYYRFANLPPGKYTVTVTAKGFATSKRELILEVGHLPNIDFSLEMGASTSVVEVSAATPLIETSVNTTVNNVTEDIIKLIPHGESFQSVIQFAPSARNEPLMGAMGSGFSGTGGCSPTGCSNGAAAGYQVGGAADSENGYLVEGQDTANNIGGYSHTNVPFDFINEVEVKSTGIEAEYGAALGGVANVIMKKGGNNWHGTVVAQYNNSALNGAPNDFPRYDPKSSGTPPCPTPQPNPPTCTGETWGFIDPTFQLYNPKKDSTKDFFPGFTLGGPIKKDRLWFFAGFNPQFTKLRRAVNNGPTNGGVLNFDQNLQTYYTNARIDAGLTSKIRVYASWLYQYQRLSGEILPHADSTPTQGFFNVSSTIPPFAFSHGLGYGAPNNTTNVGADLTLTPRLIATTRFGYYFENYRDFGFPTGGTIFQWFTSGLPPAADANGNPLPASLQQSAGFFNVANNINTTTRNANKHLQFNQDLAWVKSGLAGSHTFKFGYQLNQLSNSIFQHFNEPDINLFVGSTSPYFVAGPVGQANCANQHNVVHNPPSSTRVDTIVSCQGLYGWAQVQDFGSYGYALSRNHGFFVQDSWTMGRGVTINAGVRFEKENLPAENQPSGAPSNPINFGWGDKIAPRIGAAWDVLKNGKLKVFGSYGVVNDVMKLNLAISSFGGQYWQNCAYTLDTANLSTLVPAFDAAGRYCGGIGTNATTQATWAGGTTPAGLTFLENQNFRTFPTTCGTCTATQEGVVPGLKPYRQHESVFGADYQLAKNVALEARWDRRRLDHAIEDSAIFNPAIGSETFVIVNPGQGVNKTFDGFFKFLYGVSSGCTATSTPSCPDNIPAQRNYDGMEIRLTKAYSSHWAGMFSYTYSRLWGNYSGLTSTDIGDANGGRNSPNNSRAFDEPFFSWGANGKSSSGLMPTDRPNAFKGYTYYELAEGKHNATDFGIFSYAYSGSPQTSFADVGFAFGGFPSFPTLLAGRGKWIDVAQDPATGAVTVGNPRTFRTPWFMQSDVQLGHSYKINETKNIRFSATFNNVFNRRATTAYYTYINTDFVATYLTPGGLNIGAGGAFYSAAEHPYDVAALLNNSPTNPNGAGPITINSWYGKPFLFQLSRNIRLGLRFTF